MATIRPKVPLFLTFSCGLRCDPIKAMRRYAEKDLLDWYQKKTRMPLILRGARQVGKSTLVRIFCENNGLDLLEINLEVSKLKSIHRDQLAFADVLDEIQLLSGRKIGAKTLVFFDEIQEDPRLLQILRYFHEQAPALAVIAAGSLLELALNSEDFSFPVGRVEFLHLGPMTFQEFLLACGQDQLVEHIRARKLTDAVHAASIGYLKKYFYVGGMPRAVLHYSTENSLVEVRAIQEQIIQTFSADFPKYAKRVNVGRISRIFQACAAQVGKKTIYQAFDRESKSRDIRRVIELLIDARVILACYHAEASGVPLHATTDTNVQKLYLIDIGLMNCVHRLDFRALEEAFDGRLITKGTMAEQFVAQHLAFFYGRSSPPSLTYWLRDKGAQKGEIDFLVQHSGRIVPVEVKSESGGKLKSLFYFAAEKKWNRAVKLSLSEYSEHHVRHIIGGKSVALSYLDIPLYAVEELAAFL